MQVVYAAEEAPLTLTKSMFLAGPSPRDPRHPNWRNEALEILDGLGYDGVVFIPLPRDGQWDHSYIEQVDWENEYLNMADTIVFWVPRDLTVVEDVPEGSSAEKAMSLPAFTTNMEFGYWVTSGKAVLGCPHGASNVRYLQHHAGLEAVPMSNTLEGTLRLAVDKLGAGASRIGGEREVPLHIWKLPHFQGWYRSQVEAGNHLEGAKLLWSFRVGPAKGFTFAYALHVNVHIAVEGRNKVNEFIFGRPDITTIVAYRYPRYLGGRVVDTEAVFEDTEVAIIREFRSAARTRDGFVREFPGGSSWKPEENPFVTMTHELEEETGLGESAGFSIDPRRLRKIGSRQICGSLSVHQAHVFSCELTETEMGYLKKQEKTNITHGVVEESERTYVEVRLLGDMLKADNNDIDWSMLGMVLTAILQ